MLRESDAKLEDTRKKQISRLKKENDALKENLKNNLGPIKEITELKNQNYALNEKVRSLSSQVSKASK